MALWAAFVALQLLKSRHGHCTWAFAALASAQALLLASTAAAYVFYQVIHHLRSHHDTLSTENCSVMAAVPAVMTLQHAQIAAAAGCVTWACTDCTQTRQSTHTACICVQCVKAHVTRSPAAALPPLISVLHETGAVRGPAIFHLELQEHALLTAGDLRCFLATELQNIGLSDIVAFSMLAQSIKEVRDPGSVDSQLQKLMAVPTGSGSIASTSRSDSNALVSVAAAVAAAGFVAGEHECRHAGALQTQSYD